MEPGNGRNARIFRCVVHVGVLLKSKKERKRKRRKKKEKEKERKRKSSWRGRQKKKVTTRRIPAWSPTAVLTTPVVVWLPSSDGIGYFIPGMAVTKTFWTQRGLKKRARTNANAHKQKGECIIQARTRIFHTHTTRNSNPPSPPLGAHGKKEESCKCQSATFGTKALFQTKKWISEMYHNNRRRGRKLQVSIRRVRYTISIQEKMNWNVQ